MSSEVTLVIGLIEISFGACSRREPVTTTSSTCGGGAAGAVCPRANGTAAELAAVARASRTACRSARLGWFIRENSPELKLLPFAFTARGREWDVAAVRRLISVCRNTTRCRNVAYIPRFHWDGYRQLAARKLCLKNNSHSAVAVSQMF